MTSLKGGYLLLTYFDVANYFCWLATTLSGSVTHVKLQKIVYYVQEFYLGLYDKLIFAKEIEAWKHSFVAPVLWREYTSYQSSLISAPKKFDISVYNEKEIALLDGVYFKFGHLTPFLLVHKV